MLIENCIQTEPFRKRLGAFATYALIVTVAFVIPLLGGQGPFVDSLARSGLFLLLVVLAMPIHRLLCFWQSLVFGMPVWLTALYAFYLSAGPVADGVQGASSMLESFFVLIYAISVGAMAEFITAKAWRLTPHTAGVGETKQEQE